MPESTAAARVWRDWRNYRIFDILLCGDTLHPYCGSYCLAVFCPQYRLYIDSLDGYNLLIAIMEIVTICVFQGLDSPTSRSNLERGTGLFRTTMTGVLAVSLTVVNLIVLHETIYVSPGMCFYKDIVHNCLQISARAIFLFIAIRNSQECGLFKRLRTVDSLKFRKSGTNVVSGRRHDEVCGLCYGKQSDRPLRKLPVCGHTFHDECSTRGQILGTGAQSSDCFYSILCTNDTFSSSQCRN